ncbi:MAG: hypothetical protein ACJA2W_001898 [Planctomycetota bacterium]
MIQASGSEAPVTLPDLFSTEFMEAAQRLRLVARRVAPRGRFAEQRSKSKGSGLEFQDYRPYTHGDDLRAIDWNVYRRLGRVFVRLFEEHEDLPLYLLPDVSKSLWIESRPRVIAGLQASLALAAVSLGAHDSVGVFPFADDLSILQRPTSGKGRLSTLAARMQTLQPGGSTDLRTSLKRFGGMRLRPGLVVIVSDFFDEGGLEAIEAAVRSVRHKLLFVQLVRPTDREPKALVGDLRLVDCETSDAQDVSISPAVMQRYQAAYDRFSEGLAALARSRQAGLLALDVEGDVVPQIASLFENGRRDV